MDAFDLFRKLGAGAKFDFKRFGKDAERFKVVRSQEKDVSDHYGIDFFGTGGTHGNKEQRAAEKQEEEGEVDAVAGKRKLQDEEKTAKKKKKDTQAEVACEENEGILWTSSADRKSKGLKEGRDRDKTSMKRLQHLHQENVNRVRTQNRINVHGCDVPDPVCTFSELQSEYNLNPRVLQNLSAAGLTIPTPIQMQAIPLMMHGRELLACAPTGSGKTLAFSLPLLTHLKQPANLGIRALIISPTRELASQTHRELVRLSEGVGFRVHILDKASMAARRHATSSNNKSDILISTPNRLVFLLKQDALDLSSVEWLVVDESDKLFEDGRRGFRDQLAAVFQACSSPRVRRAFYSATCAPDVEQWCRLNLDNLVSVNIGHRNSAVETVEQELLFVGTENGKLLAVRDIIKKGFLPPMLVFVQSIDRARELFHELVYEGINVDIIHADRTQQQRDNVITSFRSGDIWVLICTALLARGMDFKGVNLVLNYDFPTSAVEYIHRIGRTGRAGRTGKAVTFFTEDDKPLLRSIANVIKQAGCPVPGYMVGFKKIHSKVKRQLQKKPPKRSTIRTTPQFVPTKGKGGEKTGGQKKIKKKGGLGGAKKGVDGPETKGAEGQTSSVGVQSKVQGTRKKKKGKKN
ncbi:probable ATP-dependent RNA helicase DDX52 [Salvelinus fontinalis]|uniref:probable ATP-dependent RNA helicase DDX52 n=1 Tax=Salvelinus fontinalis TaxID=8038 RepID=UPI002484ED18|nr:probable ATP-dependent RNA helicase DDX52 [Salvelinus fontinalis]